MIRALLNQTAEIQPFLREAAGGIVLYGNTEERPCRLETGQNYKVTGKGANGTVYETVATALMFTIGDALPDKSKVKVDDRSYVVVQCREMRGFSKSHLEVYLA